MAAHAEQRAFGLQPHIMFDKGDRMPLLGRTPPSVVDDHFIYHLLRDFFKVVNFSIYVPTVMLILIERLCNCTGHELCERNWQPIFLAAIVVAQKVCDDNYLCNADFSTVSESYSYEELILLELKFLIKLDYDLYISPSAFTAHYFRLRESIEYVYELPCTRPPLDESKIFAREARPHSA